MRCTNCGAEIPEGQWICPNCFAKVQIVPDYNPLDDVLAREVKGSVEYATRPIASQDVRRYNSWGSRENDYATRVLNQGERKSSTRVLSQGEMSRIRSQYNRPVRRNEESGYAGRESENIGRQEVGMPAGRLEISVRKVYTIAEMRGMPVENIYIKNPRSFVKRQDIPTGTQEILIRKVDMPAGLPGIFVRMQVIFRRMKKRRAAEPIVCAKIQGM